MLYVVVLDNTLLAGCDDTRQHDNTTNTVDDNVAAVVAWAVNFL